LRVTSGKKGTDRLGSVLTEMEGDIGNVSEIVEKRLGTSSQRTKRYKRRRVNPRTQGIPKENRITAG